MPADSGRPFSRRRPKRPFATAPGGGQAARPAAARNEGKRKIRVREAETVAAEQAGIAFLRKRRRGHGILVKPPHQTPRFRQSVPPGEGRKQHEEYHKDKEKKQNRFRAGVHKGSTPFPPCQKDKTARGGSQETGKAERAPFRPGSRSRRPADDGNGKGEAGFFGNRGEKEGPAAPVHRRRPGGDRLYFGDRRGLVLVGVFFELDAEQVGDAFVYLFQ